MDRLTAEEFRKRAAMSQGRKRKDRGPESVLQEACVAWFRYQYPELRGLLFSVPNQIAGDSNKGKLLVKEGLLAGVSDLMLIYPSLGYHGLAIEMKSKIGTVKGHQLYWGVEAWEAGYMYQVCRSVTRFKFLIGDYLGR